MGKQMSKKKVECYDNETGDLLFSYVTTFAPVVGNYVSHRTREWKDGEEVETVVAKYKILTVEERILSYSGSNLTDGFIIDVCPIGIDSL